MITIKRSRKTSRSLDLHTHSWYSDGALAPADLARRMRLAGVGIAALTDHDTMEGVPEFRREAKLHGMRTLPGVEVSCRCSALDTEPEVHVLVYGIEPGITAFESFLASIRVARVNRIHGMLEKLAGLGIQLELSRLEKDMARGSVGRPHLARLLLEDERVESINEAFQRYLADHKPAWLPKELPDVTELIAMCHELRGVCILAHPGKALPDHAARTMIDLGIDGLEALHPGHRAQARQHFHDLARRNGRSVSAGSDFHDPRQGRYRPPQWNAEQVGGKLARLLEGLK